ncbi:hypothetical protein PIB30_024924, partial [Stylosanthes scabra]|nr:hypothetical protein [Stylosanthes scabra]
GDNGNFDPPPINKHHQEIQSPRDAFSLPHVLRSGFMSTVNSELTILMPETSRTRLKTQIFAPTQRLTNSGHINLRTSDLLGIQRRYSRIHNESTYGSSDSPKLHKFGATVLDVGPARPKGQTQIQIPLLAQ